MLVLCDVLRPSFELTQIDLLAQIEAKMNAEPEKERNKVEEEIFMNSYIPQTLNDVFDAERDTQRVAEGEAKDLVYAKLLGDSNFTHPSSTTDAEQAMRQLSLNPAEQQQQQMQSKKKTLSNDSDMSLSDSSDEDEDEDDEDSGSEDEDEDGRPRGKRFEDRDAKKERKRQAKEEARERRKQKLPKAEKKKKIKNSRKRK